LAGGTIFGVAGGFISDICCNQQGAESGDGAKTDLLSTKQGISNSEAENPQLSNPPLTPSSPSHSNKSLLPPPPKSSLSGPKPAQTNEIALAGETSENAVAGSSVEQAPLQRFTPPALLQQPQGDVGASSIAGSSPNQNQANSPPPARVARMRSSPSLQTILEEDEEHLPELSQGSLPQTKNLSLSPFYISREMTAPSEDPAQLAHTTRAGVGGVGAEDGGVSGDGGAGVGGGARVGVRATLVFADGPQPSLATNKLPNAVDFEEKDPPFGAAEAQLGFVTSSPHPQTPLRPHQPLLEEAMFQSPSASATLAFSSLPPSPPPPPPPSPSFPTDRRAVVSDLVFSPPPGEVTEAPPSPPQPPHNIITTPLRPPPTSGRSDVAIGISRFSIFTSRNS
jgi:hypothetical protein